MTVLANRREKVARYDAVTHVNVCCGGLSPVSFFFFVCVWGGGSVQTSVKTSKKSTIKTNDNKITSL
jgi:hypothetical protein